MYLFIYINNSFNEFIENSSLKAVLIIVDKYE